MLKQLNKRAWAGAALAAAVTTAGVALRAHGDPTTMPTTTPATQPVAAAPATQPVGDIAALQSNLQADLAAFQSAFTGPQVLTDPAARKAAAPQLVPALRKVYADFDALGNAEPRAKRQAEMAESQFTTMLAVLGDAEAQARLQAAADSKDPAVSVDGKGQQLVVGWWTTATDAAAQGKVADQAAALATAHPESIPLTRQLMMMAQLGGASPDLTSRVQAIIGGMSNPMAAQVQQQMAGEQKLKGLAGKPLTVAGKQPDGKDFTTAGWKGKVILVDFWATWCGPCRAELPRLKKLYNDYHAKGLEVLGVSNDFDASALAAYTAQNGMPWPELFDATAAAAQSWNPITSGYGIEGIPTMFLIDKKGVCRTVEARESMEDLIPKMLDEN